MLTIDHRLISSTLPLGFRVGLSGFVSPSSNPVSKARGATKSSHAPRRRPPARWGERLRQAGFKVGRRGKE